MGSCIIRGLSIDERRKTASESKEPSIEVPVSNFIQISSILNAVFHDTLTLPARAYTRALPSSHLVTVAASG